MNYLKLIKKFYIVITFLLILNSVYSQSRINNKLTDFGILNYPDRKYKGGPPPEPKKERMDGQKLGKIFSSFSIQKTTQQIELGKRNIIIGSRGTRLTIPAGTFQYSDYLTAKGSATLHLYEVIDEFDYMIAGVYHIYNDLNKVNHHLQLGGMIKFEIYQGTVRLRMSGEYPILVDFPLFNPEKKFNLYYINLDGVWIKKVDYGLYDIFPSLVQEADGKKQTGVRQFKMNAQGWWGFGLPIKNMAVIKSKIISENPGTNDNFHIVSSGEGYKSYIGKWTKGLDFTIPVFPKVKSRIIVSDNQGNIGISDFHEAPPYIAFDTEQESSENVFLEIPPIYLKLVPQEYYGNEDRFREFLNLKREEVQVNYPTR